MSYQMNIAVPRASSENEEDDTHILTYRQLIMKHVLQFAGLLYLVYGICITYAWTSKELDSGSGDKLIARYFWETVLFIYCMGNVAIFSMIMLNKYWSYKAKEERLIQKLENHVIVCFMLIPLFVLSSIFNIIELIRNIAIMPCHGYIQFLAPFSTLTLLIGTAVLVFDVGYFTKTSKQWKKELIKNKLTLFTIIGITNCLVLNVAMQHMHIFRLESFNSTYGNRFKPNTTCITKKNIASSLETLFKASDKYLRPAYILFCICSLAHLAQPVVQRSSLKTVVEEETESIGTLETDDMTHELSHLIENETTLPNDIKEPEASCRLPSLSLVLCILALSLCFLSYIIMHSLRQKKGVKDYKDLGSLIYISFVSIVYGIGIGLSLVHIVEIERWPILPTKKGTIIEKFLIWVGAGGQLCVALMSITTATITLGNGVNEINQHCKLTLLCIIIVADLLLILQTLIQTIQVSLLLDRKWIRPETNSWVESLCPTVGIMGLNLGLLLLSVDRIKSPVLSGKTNVMFIDLSATELGGVGQSLCVLQRLHGSLLFAGMIMYTHN